MGDCSRILDATIFAAKRHRNKKRKSAERSSHIDHPLSVARLLSVEGGITDVEVLVAALLHDIIEDTETTEQELLALFGARVTGIVLEVTDYKCLTKAERKKLQISNVYLNSTEAATVKIADKICNLRDVAANPPRDWPKDLVRVYFDEAARVVAGLRPTLDIKLCQLFTSAYSLMTDASRSASNCTRVTAAHVGMKGYVTFRDHESAGLKEYVEYEQAQGATITMERGVWTEL